MRNILAWEPAADDIHGNAICPEAIGSENCDIVVAGDAGPVLGEDAAAVGIDLAEGDGSHAGALEAEGEAANAAEKVEDIHKMPP